MNYLEKELNHAANLLKCSPQDVGKRIEALHRVLKG